MAHERVQKTFRSEGELPGGWFLHRFGEGTPLLVPIRDGIVLGRSELLSDRISRRHARLTLLDDDRLLLQDLDTKNGTFVNGKRISAKGTVLEDCDCVCFGLPAPKSADSYGFILRYKDTSDEDDVTIANSKTHVHVQALVPSDESTPNANIICETDSSSDLEPTSEEILSVPNSEPDKSCSIRTEIAVDEQNHQVEESQTSDDDCSIISVLPVKKSVTKSEPIHTNAEEIDMNLENPCMVEEQHKECIIVISTDEEADSDETDEFIPETSEHVTTLKRRSETDDVIKQSKHVPNKKFYSEEAYRRLLSERQSARRVCSEETKGNTPKKHFALNNEHNVETAIPKVSSHKKPNVTEKHKIQKDLCSKPRALNENSMEPKDTQRSVSKKSERSCNYPTCPNVNAGGKLTPDRNPKPGMVHRQLPQKSGVYRNKQTAEDSVPCRQNHFEPENLSSQRLQELKKIHCRRSSEGVVPGARPHESSKYSKQKYPSPNGTLGINQRLDEVERGLQHEGMLNRQSRVPRTSSQKKAESDYQYNRSVEEQEKPVRNLWRHVPSAAPSQKTLHQIENNPRQVKTAGPESKRPQASQSTSRQIHLKPGSQRPVVTRNTPSLNRENSSVFSNANQSSSQQRCTKSISGYNSSNANTYDIRKYLQSGSSFSEKNISNDCAFRETESYLDEVTARSPVNGSVGRTAPGTRVKTPCRRKDSDFTDHHNRDSIGQAHLSSPKHSTVDICPRLPAKTQKIDMYRPGNGRKSNCVPAFAGDKNSSKDMEGEMCLKWRMTKLPSAFEMDQFSQPVFRFTGSFGANPGRGRGRGQPKDATKRSLREGSKEGAKVKIIKKYGYRVPIPGGGSDIRKT